MKLNIEKLEIRNFRSHGDIDEKETIHSIELNKRGPVLICGNNGAGKSTIVEAIVWCLFGRLSDKPNPGDNVINWDTKNNCLVKIITSDGYQITRTRKYKGHSDLLILKDGNPIEKGDSTNANAQSTLCNLFGLDFNLFISSLFFGQSSGSFLSLSDSKKKSAIESMFGLSKLNYYAKVAKERINKCDEVHSDLKKKISNIQASIESINSDINKYKKLSDKFESDRKESIEEKKNKIERLESKNRKTINIDELKSSWELIEKSKKKLTELGEGKEEAESDLKKVINAIANITREKSDIEYEIKKINLDINNIKSKIESMEEKEGTKCPTCEQVISKEFIKSKISEIRKESKKEMESFSKKISELKSKEREILNKEDILNNKNKDLQNKLSKISNVHKKLKDSINKSIKNKVTISEAKSKNQFVDSINEKIEELKKSIEDENNKENNYNKLINEANNKIKEKKDDIKSLEERCEDIGKEASHLTYIYRAHSDKKNLRSYMISGSIPMLNNRLSYYFNELNIMSDIKFNQSLQIKSDKWPYEFHSGGEKARVDLSLMCSMYDTFVSIYGQQCNIVVLDELDKEFDNDGVDEYVRLIIDDLSNRMDTILVISHKEDIKYAFPTQMKISKKNDLSYVE